MWAYVILDTPHVHKQDLKQGDLKQDLNTDEGRETFEAGWLAKEAVKGLFSLYLAVSP